MVIHVKKIAFILKMHKPSVILSDSMITVSYTHLTLPTIRLV